MFDHSQQFLVWWIHSLPKMSGLICSFVVTCISSRAFDNMCIDCHLCKRDCWYLEVRSMSLSFLLEERVLEASLRFETFTITSFGPFLLLIQWQFSTLEGSTLTSSFSKIFKTLLSRVLLSLVSGILVNSRHSRLENWLLLQHWCSKLVTFSLNRLNFKTFESNYLFKYFWMAASAIFTDMFDHKFSLNWKNKKKLIQVHSGITQNLRTIIRHYWKLI